MLAVDVTSAGSCVHVADCWKKLEVESCRSAVMLRRMHLVTDAVPGVQFSEQETLDYEEKSTWYSSTKNGGLRCSGN